MKNIPVLHVSGKTLAETYEKALIKLYNEGCRFKTQYDKPDDPESIDATMNLTIEEPMTDPMIHKAFPGGIEDLREYVMEFKGFKNHWVKNMNDPEDTRWEYTYNGRLKNYGQWKEKTPFDLGNRGTVMGFYNIDQIEMIISKLVKQPFSRQCQMITWMPNLDLNIFDPPCLQSMWYRMAEENGEYYLNCNIRFRSNDAWGACFMNMFGLTMFNREVIADEIQKRTGKKVHLARMNWQADSWHIYGKDIKQAKERLFDRLPKDKDYHSEAELVRMDTLSERTFNFYDPDIQEMYNEAEAVVLAKIAEYDKEHQK